MKLKIGTLERELTPEESFIDKTGAWMVSFIPTELELKEIEKITGQDLHKEGWKSRISAEVPKPEDLKLN